MFSAVDIWDGLMIAGLAAVVGFMAYIILDGLGHI